MVEQVDRSGRTMAAARWSSFSGSDEVEFDEELPLEDEEPELPKLARPVESIRITELAGADADTLSNVIAQITVVADDRYLPIETNVGDPGLLKSLGFVFDEDKGLWTLNPILARKLGQQQGLISRYESKNFEILEDPGKSGNGHIKTIDGARLWGKYGAAGVMIRNVDPMGTERFLLVQRGPSVSSNRWKWQLPGGAIESLESDYQGTARELQEELEPPEGFLDSIKALGEVKFEHPSGWHYTNIAADAPQMFEPKVDTTETNDGQWFTHEEIAELPLHPAFRESLNDLMAQIGSSKVELPEVPIEPDLDLWEPNRYKTQEAIDAEFFEESLSDLTDQELLDYIEELDELAADAEARGDMIDRLIWSSQANMLRSQLPDESEDLVHPTDIIGKMLEDGEYSEQMTKLLTKFKERFSREGVTPSGVGDSYANFVSQWRSENLGPIPQPLVDSMNEWMLKQDLTDSVHGDPQAFVQTPDGRWITVDEALAPVLEDMWKNGIDTEFSDVGSIGPSKASTRFGGYISFPSEEDFTKFATRYNVRTMEKTGPTYLDVLSNTPEDAVWYEKTSRGGVAVRFNPSFVGYLRSIVGVTASVRPDMMTNHAEVVQSSPEHLPQNSLEELDTLKALLACVEDTIITTDTRRAAIMKRRSLLGKK